MEDRRGRWGGEGDEGYGAVAVEVEEEGWLFVGGGVGGEVVCFLSPVGGVCFWTVAWGEEVGVAWEGIFGCGSGGI